MSYEEPKRTGDKPPCSPCPPSGCGNCDRYLAEVGAAAYADFKRTQCSLITKIETIISVAAILAYGETLSCRGTSDLLRNAVEQAERALSRHSQEAEEIAKDLTKKYQNP